MDEPEQPKRKRGRPKGSLNKNKTVKRENAFLPPALPVSLDPKKLGRPSTYDPEYCDYVLDMGREGKSRTQIAAGLGVSLTALKDWENAHEEFAVALKESRDLSMAWWENAGQLNLARSGFNAVLYIFQMKSRFRDEYGDVQTVRHTGAAGGAMELNVSGVAQARKVAFALSKALERRKQLKIDDGTDGDGEE